MRAWSSKSVGIITFHCADNFGATLQAYALQQIIQKMGYYPEIIDFCPKGLIDPYRITTPKSFNLKEILKFVAKKVLLNKNYLNKINSFQSFREKYMILSKTKYTESKELKKNPPIYDIYLTGSDQVWNPYFVKQLGLSYLLDFPPSDAYRISYAASVVEDIPEELVDIYAQNLERFKFISVREKSSKKILEKIIPNKKIEVCLDPVFLLEVEKWRRICKESVQKFTKPYILVIDLIDNKNFIIYVNRFIKRTKLPVISFSIKIPLRSKYMNHLTSFYFDGPIEILSYISNAEYILTSSFHGLSFSLIFRKKFICMPDYIRGNRMVDLLLELDMNDCILYPHATSEEIKSLEPRSISSDAIDKLNDLRTKSLEFLKKALSEYDKGGGDLNE